jgi:hypothetical protein
MAGVRPMLSNKTIQYRLATISVPTLNQRSAGPERTFNRGSLRGIAATRTGNHGWDRINTDKNGLMPDSDWISVGCMDEVLPGSHDLATSEEQAVPSVLIHGHFPAVASLSLLPSFHIRRTEKITEGREKVRNLGKIFRGRAQQKTGHCPTSLLLYYPFESGSIRGYASWLRLQAVRG